MPHFLSLFPPGALALLGQEDGLDVGQDAALGDGHASQKLVKLLVVPIKARLTRRPQLRK